MPTYPYISGQAAVVQAFGQLRKGFPNKVDAGYLQRFRIAASNESYVISILKFLQLIDEEGNRRDENTSYFYGDDASFQRGLEGALRVAYAQVFDEMADDALTTDRSKLTNWFRSADKTSDLVGTRQASTFQTLASLAGHGDAATTRTSPAKKAPSTPRSPAAKKTAARPDPTAGGAQNSSQDGRSGTGTTSKNSLPAAAGVGVTVRIEVNLPANGDASTYDAIFASIKKHLMS